MDHNSQAAWIAAWMRARGATGAADALTAYNHALVCELPAAVAAHLGWLSVTRANVCVTAMASHVRLLPPHVVWSAAAAAGAHGSGTASGLQCVTTERLTPELARATGATYAAHVLVRWTVHRTEPHTHVCAAARNALRADVCTCKSKALEPPMVYHDVLLMHVPAMLGSVVCWSTLDAGVAAREHAAAEWLAPGTFCIDGTVRVARSVTVPRGGVPPRVYWSARARHSLDDGAHSSAEDSSGGSGSQQDSTSIMSSVDDNEDDCSSSTEKEETDEEEEEEEKEEEGEAEAMDDDKDSHAHVWRRLTRGHTLVVETYAAACESAVAAAGARGRIPPPVRLCVTATPMLDITVCVAQVARGRPQRLALWLAVLGLPDADATCAWLHTAGAMTDAMLAALDALLCDVSVTTAAGAYEAAACILGRPPATGTRADVDALQCTLARCLTPHALSSSAAAQRGSSVTTALLAHVWAALAHLVYTAVATAVRSSAGSGVPARYTDERFVRVAAGGERLSDAWNGALRTASRRLAASLTRRPRTDVGEYWSTGGGAAQLSADVRTRCVATLRASTTAKCDPRMPPLVWVPSWNAHAAPVEVRRVAVPRGASDAAHGSRVLTASQSLLWCPFFTPEGADVGGLRDPTVLSCLRPPLHTQVLLDLVSAVLPHWMTAAGYSPSVWVPVPPALQLTLCSSDDDDVVASHATTRPWPVLRGACLPALWCHTARGAAVADAEAPDDAHHSVAAYARTRQILEWLQPPSTHSGKWARVWVAGVPVGWTAAGGHTWCAAAAAATTAGVLPPTVSVYQTALGDVWVCADAGVPLVPLLPSAAGMCAVAHMKMADTVSDALVYADAWRLADDPHTATTGALLHEAAASCGLLAACTPAAHHNPPVRVTFQAHTASSIITWHPQAMPPLPLPACAAEDGAGVDAPPTSMVGNTELCCAHRLDGRGDGWALAYPQMPLVDTDVAAAWAATATPLHVKPLLGWNALVAVMSGAAGANQDDAIVVNAAPLQRGAARLVCRHTVRTTVAFDETLTNPWLLAASSAQSPRQPTCVVTRLRSQHAYHALDDDGLARVGARVRNGDVLVGRTSPSVSVQPQPQQVNPSTVREWLEAGTVTGTGNDSQEHSNGVVVVDTSTVLHCGDADVYSVAAVAVHDALPDAATSSAAQWRAAGRTVVVVLRSTASLAPGDKLANRHAQKGVIATLRPDADMPWIAYGPAAGCRLDAMINMHALPSRMTVGHLFETLLSGWGVAAGAAMDATPFAGAPAADLLGALASAGVLHTAHCVDGVSGVTWDAPVEYGFTLYQVLARFASRLAYARGPRGPTNALRQPTDGRAAGGGIRFGDMEVAAAVAHGAAAVVCDRMITASDGGAVLHVCGACGTTVPASMSSEEGDPSSSTCAVCGSSTNHVQRIPTTTSYAALHAYAGVLGVDVRYLQAAATEARNDTAWDASWPSLYMAAAAGDEDVL